MASTNYWKCVSNFPSVWLANQQQLFKPANHVVYSHPGAKLGMQEKGFAAGMKSEVRLISRFGFVSGK